MNIADCTVPEKILLAANQLEKDGQSPFSAEALIVGAWSKFPRTFGLKGYADQYPDSNKVLSSIMGEKGLAKRGWLSKMGQKLYALTREGRLVINRIMEGGDVPAAPEGVKLTRDQDRFLLTLFSSTAVEKFEENRKPELTFGDACRYWGITENMRGEILDSRMNRFGAQLAEMERTLGNTATELSNGRHLSLEDLAQLGEIHQYLEDRFARHLNLLRSRAEKA